MARRCRADERRAGDHLSEDLMCPRAGTHPVPERTPGHFGSAEPNSDFAVSIVFPGQSDVIFGFNNAAALRVYRAAGAAEESSQIMLTWHLTAEP